jgi:AraC family transcriptional regulator, positive regulator of tynA and feaB
MRLLVTTPGIAARKKFDVWRDISYERLVPSEARQTGDGVFEGAREAAEAGGLLITRSTFAPLRTQPSASRSAGFRSCSTNGACTSPTGSGSAGSGGRPCD